MTLKLGVAALVATAAIAPGAGTATASDQSLRAVVKQQEMTLTKDSRNFARVAKRFSDRKATISQVKLAAGKVILDTDAYRAAIAPEKASTERVAKGKRQLAWALRELRAGLRKLNAALTLAKHRDPRARKRFRSAMASIRAAEVHGSRALRLIGI